MAHRIGTVNAGPADYHSLVHSLVINLEVVAEGNFALRKIANPLQPPEGVLQSELTVLWPRLVIVKSS